MTFKELVNEILTQQDSVTHYNERGDIEHTRLYQAHRADAVQSLADWVEAQVAVEREACALVVTENANYRAAEAAHPDATHYVRSEQHFAAMVLYDAAAAIRARRGEEEDGLERECLELPG